MLLEGNAGFHGIDSKYLPELVEPGQEIGTITAAAAETFGLDPDTRINVGAFDQACGAIGAGNIKPGIASESTGSALVTVATIDKLSEDSTGEVPTLCSGIPGKYLSALLYRCNDHEVVPGRILRDRKTDRKGNRSECIYSDG